MSISSWIKEFYRVPADEVKPENAAAHSLRKWTGLLKSNLKKHKLGHNSGNYLFNHSYSSGDGKAVFEVSYDTCALCQNAKDAYGTVVCHTCPLYEIQGNEGCGVRTGDPFQVWYDNSNPRPMIANLKKLVKLQQKAKKESR